MKLRNLLLLPLVFAASPALAQSGDACTLPGVLIVADPAGDQHAPVATTAPDPFSGHDIQGVYWAEPAPAAGGADKISVTLKVDTLDFAGGQAPPNTVYYVRFFTSDGVERWFNYNPYPVPTNPNFRYGHIEVVGTVSNNVSDGATDPASNAKPDGSVTWVLAKSKLPSLGTGTFVDSIKGEVDFVAGEFGSGFLETVDDTATGEYELRGNAACGGKSGTDIFAAGALTPAPLLILLLGALARRRALSN